VRALLIAAGTRMPPWVQQGYAEYSRRLGSDLTLELREIDVVKRTKTTDLDRAREQECDRMLRSIPGGAVVVALDAGGPAWSSEEWARHIEDWRMESRDLALLIGGPDGLSPRCLEAARHRVSLSPLTFPHALVRVIVAELLYRAWSILSGHPYHR
jgi:23S rRNA (pseudouridine1915-N3)-methyltransferase